MIENSSTPVGVAGTVSGTVTVRHDDGSIGTVTTNDKLFSGDILETGAGAAIGIILADRTTVSLGSHGRLSLDEVRYDPATQAGTATLSVDQGAFSLASGQIAHTRPDSLQIRTPVMTIGVRGTTIAGTVGANGHTQVALLPDADGTVGQVTLSNQSGSMVLNTAFTMAEQQSPTSPFAPPVPVSPQTIESRFGQAMQALPPAPQPQTDTPPQQQDDSTTFNWYKPATNISDQVAAKLEAGLGELDFNAMLRELAARGLTEEDLLDLIDEALTSDLGDEEDIDQAEDEAEVSGISLTGTAGDDTLTGGGGDDVLSGLAGADRLYGEAGNDILYGGDGIDSLWGGIGADTLYGGLGGDSLYLGDDHDADVVGYSAADIAAGNVDQVNQVGTEDIVDLSAIASQMNAGNGAGLGGVLAVGDELTAYTNIASPGSEGSGIYKIQWDSNNDQNYDFMVNLWSSISISALFLTPDGRVLLSTASTGTSGDDIASGTAVNGGDGNDILFGLGAAAVLDGGGGNDILYGTAGNDILTGGSGNDTLIGGLGTDQLTGGSGNDVFSFLGGNAAAVGDRLISLGADTITDFDSGSDKIQLNATVFGLNAGDSLTDSINYFEDSSLGNVSGAAGTSGIIAISNGGTVALYYCQDLSNASSSSYQVATLAATDLNGIDAGDFALAS
ncbi:FecR domain-containing protein [Magnetospirillum sulfuroxidans]|uniref:FecR domain-containing protein n=1 Tax=Magnetospirillum sulfuroxidans TaxID=611300 RepID=A0ABS5I7D6_9PROT|nr:FecR domain-containing protein [Magnetospirillum sulfuroxidans]MBR9970156.1 FecR domain-containing protein [Magnetospirillum sulfuroxidans]